jgi:hypothetical protein
MGLRRRFVLAIGLVLAHAQCASTPEATRDRAQNAAGASGTCPARVKAGALLPGVNAEETKLNYWLARYSQRELDAVLMDDAAIAAYNLRVGRRPGRDAFSQRDLRVPLDPLVLASDTRDRLNALRPDVSNGKLLTSDNRTLADKELAAFSQNVVTQMPPSLRVLLEPATMRCGPYAGALFRPDNGGVTAYDKNSCGLLRAQEVVELLGKAENGMWLARTRSAFGWLPSEIALSPVIPASLREAYLAGPRVEAREELRLTAAGGPASLPEHTLVPKRGRHNILVAGAQRFHELPRPPQMLDTARPVTRRAVLEAAFAYLDTAYGLGGAQGGLDCSGLLFDLFDSFDVALPRFSGWQAEAGSYGIDVSAASDAQKLQRIDQAAKSGIVLAYFPGHMMLYLGKNASGEPMVLHALGEYAQPCGEGRETVVDVQRTVVSGLELGRGSSRKSLLERITRLVVFGGEPPSELAPHVVPGPSEPPRLPAAASCRDSVDSRIFVSPITPVAGQPLRVIATFTKAPGDGSLWIYDSDGKPVPLDELRLGGPPFARVARSLKAPSGPFPAVVGTED